MTSQAEIRARQIKSARREVLEALKMAYPGHLTYVDVCHVCPMIDEHHIRRDLAYFIAKGYVEDVNVALNMRWDDRSFRLTAKGVEVGDQITTDPALEP